MMTEEQRARLLAVIKRQPANPPAPRLSDNDIEAIRKLLDSGLEDEAWRALNEMWIAAFAKAHAAITQQSADIASNIELQKMARRTRGAMNTLFQVHTKAPSAVGEQTFRPRVAWQIALFDAWPEICKACGHAPSASEAVSWLMQNDSNGCFVDPGTEAAFGWRLPDGAIKEIDLKTVDTVLAAWANAGMLPV